MEIVYARKKVSPLQGNPFICSNNINVFVLMLLKTKQTFDAYFCKITCFFNWVIQKEMSLTGVCWSFCSAE